MHIALISVALPYRGGISKHTSILNEKLKKYHSVELINFSRQYPDYLFPGKTQFIEDLENDYPGTRCIDSINPLSWFKTGNMLAKKNFDLVIFRFWNPFFAPALGIIAGILKRKSPSSKLISLCDNILPHESTPLGGILTRNLFRKMDGHLVQSGQTETELQEVVENPVYEKRFHPVYDTFPPKMEKQQARIKLGLPNKKIVLYFGIIRDYKGFDILLRAVEALKDKTSDFHLLAVGECYGSREKYTDLISNLEIQDFITWHDQYIPDDEVSEFFSAADIAALPYRSASQSGVVQIAYNYDLPVIVTNVGGLPEIVEEGKSGITLPPEDPAILAEVICQILESGRLEEMSNYIQEFKNKFSWDNFIEGIDTLYNRL